MSTNTSELRGKEDLRQIYSEEQCQPPQDVTVACYYFPHYQRSALNDQLYGPGWTEHVLRRAARPWFPGHRQPRMPLWDEHDEGDPQVIARHIDLAADHGLGAFIYDWYWYDGAPALHEGLENGFMRAPNRARMKFAVMWCPHDWPIWTPDLLPDGTISRRVARSGPETPDDVRRSLEYIISRYLHEPNYWCIDDEPVIVIWELARLQRVLGSDGVAPFLDELRDQARRLGHRGIHFHASSAGSGGLIDHFERSGFDSYGHYTSIVGVHREVAQGAPTVSYARCAARVVTHFWPEQAAASSLPYIPNVGAGWDHTPRQLPPGEWPPPPDWPGLPIVVDDNPAAFEALIMAALAYLNANPSIPPVVTIGCWNEWTEGHYLLPDTDRGMGMLIALANALGKETVQQPRNRLYPG
jgi:hypothetical protein